MARIRSIHPGLFTDADFVKMSDAAQIFYVGLLTEADDFGAFKWEPVELKMRIRGASLQPVEPLLDELVQAQRVVRYQHDGRYYGLIRNFTKYQSPKSPKSRYFIPPDYRKFAGSSDANAEESGDEADMFPTNGEKSPQREGRGVGEDDGGERETGEEGARAPPKPNGKSKVASRLPDDFAPSEEDVRSAYADGLSDDEARREFEKFKDYWRSKPGKDGTKLDWSATFRNWMRRAADGKRERAGRVSGGQGAAARH
ncbi:hypothetical protein [Taklimakanibacter deserti]|uniref:hypothetical protein n=1 Tax=Taklimakanibacter deserti TaxID=2267839 RepID=UPI000E6496FF